MIIIPGEPERKSNSLMSTVLWQAEAARIFDRHEKWKAHMRVAELRRSCGIEPELSTINIRRPPRYEGEFIPSPDSLPL